MQAFLLILSLAIIVEALVQYAKTIITMLENKQYKTFGTQLAAILIAVFYLLRRWADIFALMGISFSVHWLGTPAHGDRHFPRFELCKRPHQKASKPGHWGDRSGGYR